MSRLTSKRFVIDTAERVVATGAQAALGFLAVGTVADVDWRHAAAVIGTAMAAALLKAVVKRVRGSGAES